MLIVVDSLTGMCRKYAESLGYPVVDIDRVPGHCEEDMFLVTRCYNFGEIPEPTLHFLEEYKDSVIGVACGGNRNWGLNYAIVGDKIEKIYGIPCVAKFEGWGFPKERQISRDFLEQYEKGEGKV